MKRNRILIGTGALLGLAALAFGHHVARGLSYTGAPEILSSVTFRTSVGNFGLPAYVVGATEAPGHAVPVGLADGDSFSVMDDTGTMQTITLNASDFADISTAVMADVVAVINAKASLITAHETNGYLLLEGQASGAARTLQVSDGAGGPLFKMGMNAAQAAGSDDLELTISIPDPNLNLAGRTYVVLASATDGSFPLNQKVVPIGLDGLTQPFLDAALGGALQGFVGQLDGNSDATARITASQLVNGFAGNYPDQLYLAYVVLSPNGRRIDYVSNRFTVDFQ